MNVFVVAQWMHNVIHRNNFFNMKKKFSLFKVIKLNKLFPEFLPILYFNQKNIYLNQINNAKK